MENLDKVEADDGEITRQVKALADWLGARDRTRRRFELVAERR